MYGNPPSPATTSHPLPASLLPWASAADRQSAARDAYRTSVSEGGALTGAALGKMFDRSPRWGVDRIAEVRAEADQRRDGSNPQPAADADGGTPELLTGSDRSNGNRSRLLESSNGSGTASASLPIRSSNYRKDRSRSAGDASAASAAAAAAAAAAAGTAMTAPAVADTAVTPAVRRITTTAVVAVALVAASASYDHQRLLAEMAGEGWRAWLLPFSVDGLVVAASMSMLVRRRMGRRAGALAWIALILGVAVSVTANVAAAEPTLVGRLVAAWPPVALLLAFEICLSIGATHARTGHQPREDRR